jgi:hypothetical protein
MVQQKGIFIGVCSQFGSTLVREYVNFFFLGSIFSGMKVEGDSVVSVQLSIVGCQDVES